MSMEEYRSAIRQRVAERIAQRQLSDSPPPPPKRRASQGKRELLSGADLQGEARHVPYCG